MQVTISKSRQPAWKTLVRPYEVADVRRSVVQALTSFGPYFALWAVMYFSLRYSYWVTLLLALPTAGMVVRIFIIQHDCGHGSFFPSRRANDMLGVVCGVLTLTPYYQWRRSHAIHHATAGNLDRRDIHDVYTMTVREYQALSFWGRLRYRLYRNPITLFMILPMTLFVVLYRFPSPIARRKDRINVLWNNVAVVTLAVLMSVLIGVRAFLLIYVPVLIVATTVGTWLFFIQHQFEETYWADGKEWSYEAAALQGSSYYKLPRVLQWFTGNIGFHHIHHLSPRIPNYMLEKCHEENPEFQKVTVLTLATSIRLTFLSLWDEERKKLVSFREARRNYAGTAQGAAQA